MSKITKVRITKNVNGNYVCFIGRTNAQTLSTEFSALFWLLEQSELPLHEISSTSYFSEQEVKIFKDSFVDGIKIA